MADVSCNLLPTKMREFRTEWESSGSIAAFDFGLGLVTASNITTDVDVRSGSLETRPDGLALDYQTSWAFGPIETGSIVSGSISSAWKVENSHSAATQTGSVFLARENDAGDNWRTGSLLFIYTGSAIKEIDLTFDQSARPVVCGDRDVVISGSVTTSLVHLYRFVIGDGDFVFSEVATGSSPRVILDDPIDTTDSDILLFYVKSLTSENAQQTYALSSGSGIDDTPSSSLCSDAITMSLTPYKVSIPATTERGFFTSRHGIGVSVGITGSFNTPVSAVGAKIVDPDFDTNEIIAFNAAGAEVGRKTFLGDNTPGVETKDLQIVDVGNAIIKSFTLSPGSGDYVAYDYILIATTASCDARTFSNQQIYFRQQRENYTVERVVPLIEARFQELLSIIVGQFTGSIGTLDPEDAGLDGTLFASQSVCQVGGFASGTLSGSFQGLVLPNVSATLPDTSFISRSTWLAGSGTTNPGAFGSAIDGVSGRWTPGVAQAVGQQFIINFRSTQSLGGLHIQHKNDEQPATFDIFTATASGSFVTQAFSVSGTNPGISDAIGQTHLFTESVDVVFLQLALRSTNPVSTQWGIEEIDVFNQTSSLVFPGTLTGSHFGRIDGFVSGCMTGTVTHSGDLVGSVTASSTSQSLVDGDNFLYELFLEDTVKLNDNRVALYVSRRNIDSGSSDFGEYRVNKFETILFPQRVVEDQWSASVDFLTGSLKPIIQHSVFDKDSFVSHSMAMQFGTSSLTSFVIDHVVFDKDSFVSHSMAILAETSSLDIVVIAHSVFDKDSFVSHSMAILAETSSLDVVIITHMVFDKDSFVSHSMAITSGSFEVA